MAPQLPAPGVPEHWGWPNFTPAELTCRHTGLLIVVPRFMDKLQRFRTWLGFACPVTSGYRHPSHPEERKKAQPGAHTWARAVDIRVSGIQALTMVERAREFGFTGIGVSQPAGSDGPSFVHLDDVTTAEGYHVPRPAFWSY